MKANAVKTAVTTGEKKGTKVVLEKAKITQKKEPMKAPLDFFGISPKFFINRSIKTLTWIGFFFTIFLVGSVVTLFAIYLRSYLNKSTSLVNSINMITDEKPYIDLKEQDQMIMFEYYYSDDLSALSVVTPTYNLVTENKKKGILEKEPLTFKDCADVTFRGEKIKYSNHCMQFPKSTRIGGNWRDGTKQYIEVKIRPCTVDCDPLYELSNPDYETNIAEFFYLFGSYIKFLEAISEFGKYDKPFDRIIGSTYTIYLDSSSIIRKNLVLEQQIVETMDGTISRAKREDIALQFREFLHS